MLRRQNEEIVCVSASDSPDANDPCKVKVDKYEIVCKSAVGMRFEGKNIRNPEKICNTRHILALSNWKHACTSLRKTTFILKASLGMINQACRAYELFSAKVQDVVRAVLR